MQNLEASGRLIQWAVELGKHNILYQCRKAIKGQVITGFVVEFTSSWLRKEGTNTCTISVGRLYADGSSNHYGSEAGLILLTKKEPTHALYRLGDCMLMDHQIIKEVRQDWFC